MATRFYLPATAAPTAGLTPTLQGAWTQTGILARAMMSTTKIGDTMTTVTYDDADSADQQIIFRQWLSAELTAGQTITGGQTWEIQVRASQTVATNNMFVRRYLAIIASNGSTVRKVMVAASLDNLEAVVTTLTNRANGGTTAATNYTTVTGDRVLLELGMSGNPTSSAHHDSSMSFGDNSATDLASADDTDTDPDNPYLNLTDTLTFVAPTLALTGTVTTATEPDIVAGGKTVILTLTAASWIASGTLFNAQRQNIINGMDSAQSEAAGWDVKVKGLQGVAGVVRTSDTVVTITLDAQAAYAITANETITVTIPASAISGGVGFVASPTFVVTNVTLGAITATASVAFSAVTDINAQGKLAATATPTFSTAANLVGVAAVAFPTLVMARTSV